MKLRMELDDKGLRRGFSDFKTANKIAVRNTLNTAAALTRRNAVKNIDDEFILRNNFTKRSIQFDKVSSNDISKMSASVGALKRASYMETQEKGGKRPRKGAVTAMPQRRARTGGSFAKPVTRSKYIKKIQPRIVSGPHKKTMPTHRAYGVAQMAMAYKKKIFLKRNDNIYFVSSFTSRNGKVKARLEHLYYISAKTIIVKKAEWLRPATIRPSQDLGKIYRSQLRKLWKYGALK